MLMEFPSSTTHNAITINTPGTSAGIITELLFFPFSIFSIYTKPLHVYRYKSLQYLQLISAKRLAEYITLNHTAEQVYRNNRTFILSTSFLFLYTAVSTKVKVVSQKRKSVRDNAEWYYG